MNKKTAHASDCNPKSKKRKKLCLVKRLKFTPIEKEAQCDRYGTSSVLDDINLIDDVAKTIIKQEDEDYLLAEKGQDKKPNPYHLFDLCREVIEDNYEVSNFFPDL